LVVFSVTGPALAAPVTVTITGTVTSGIDEGGFFGASNTNLAGSAYTLSYLFDTSLGVRTTSPSWDYLVGQSPFSQSPSLGATFTIGSSNLFFSGNFSGTIWGRDNGTTSDRLQTAYDTNISFVQASGAAPTGVLPVGIETAFAYDFLPASDTFGQLLYTFGSRTTNLLFTLGRIETTVGISETPLPAALPLFATVLGGAGFAAWRRKRKAAAVAA
jgi:hypothetical protein